LREKALSFIPRAPNEGAPASNKRLIEADPLTSFLRQNTVKAPRVSIGMPVWNSDSALFASAIESLLAQDFSDYEIILSDNGSSEPARQMYAETARRDSRIRLIRHDKNTGAIANFRFVLEQARGDLFMWAADDDSRSPQLLGRLVAALDERPSCVAAGSRVVLIDEHGRRTGIAKVDSRHVGSSSPARRILGMLADYPNMDVYGLHRRRALAEVDLTLPSISIDRHIILETLLRGPIARVDEELFYYRHAVQRDESYARRAHQHFGDGGSPTHSAQNGAGAWAGYDFAKMAFQLLSSVLVSQAPLTTAERSECFLALLMVLVSEGWFTRDELYRVLPELKRAVEERDLATTMRLGARLMAISPLFPFRMGVRKATRLFQRSPVDR
jgi:glycosyltransferase involved in cell wall biosynthesis